MNARTLPGNRRTALLAAGAAIALIAIVLLVKACTGGSDDTPPQARAAELVPDKTLVFVDLSTDRDRDAVKRALDLAHRFGAYGRTRDALVQRLSGTGKPVDSAKDVQPWLGKEVAFALMDSGGGTAGSLVAIQVTDEGKARKFLARNPRPAVKRTYKGHETVRYGTVTTSFVRGFLVIGQDPTVQAAIDRDVDDSRALPDDPTYRRAIEGMPDGRFGLAYASADGLRRLLVPQGDILGGLSVLLDQPALNGVAVAGEVDERDRLRLRIHSALDAGVQGSSRGRPKPFEPSLLGAVPKDALAYLGASGVSATLQRLVITAIGGTNGGADVSSLLGRLGSELDKQTQGGLQSDLLGLFDGEVALVIQRATPAPILSLVAKTQDEEGTRRTLDRLRDPLAKLLQPQGEDPPRWQAQDVGGRDAWTLTLPNGAAITYAIGDGRLVLSTSADGVRGLLGDHDSIEDAGAFKDVLASRPDRVGTLGFLDFSQLLELGEQTGLNDSRAYLAARDDLRKVRAVGVSSTSGEGESTAEILVSIR